MLDKRELVAFVRALLEADAAAASLSTTTVEVTDAIDVADGGYDARTTFPGAPRRGAAMRGNVVWQIKTGARRPDPDEVTRRRKGKRNRYDVRTAIADGAAYQLVWNKQLTDRSRRQLEQDFRAAARTINRRCRVRVVAAEGLLSWVQRQPQRLHDLNVPGFALRPIQQDAIPFTCDHSREKAIEAIAAHVGTPADYVFAVTGPSGAGKSRTIREAVRRAGLSDETLVAATPSFVDPTLTALTVDAATPLVVVVEQCSQRDLPQLASLVEASDGWLRLIIDAVTEIAPNTPQVRIKPFEQSSAYDFLERVGLDPGAASRVFELFGGFPTLLLAAAQHPRPSQVANAPTTDSGIAALLDGINVRALAVHAFYPSMDYLDHFRQKRIFEALAVARHEVEQAAYLVQDRFYGHDVYNWNAVPPAIAGYAIDAALAVHFASFQSGFRELPNGELYSPLRALAAANSPQAAVLLRELFSRLPASRIPRAKRTVDALADRVSVWHDVAERAPDLVAPLLTQLPPILRALRGGAGSRRDLVWILEQDLALIAEVVAGGSANDFAAAADFLLRLADSDGAWGGPLVRALQDVLAIDAETPVRFKERISRAWAIAEQVGASGVRNLLLTLTRDLYKASFPSLASYTGRRRLPSGPSAHVIGTVLSVAEGDSPLSLAAARVVASHLGPVVCDPATKPTAIRILTHQWQSSAAALVVLALLDVEDEVRDQAVAELRAALLSHVSTAVISEVARLIVKDAPTELWTPRFPVPSAKTLAATADLFINHDDGAASLANSIDPGDWHGLEWGVVKAIASRDDGRFEIAAHSLRTTHLVRLLNAVKEP